MAKSAAKAIILGKREQEDGFETRPILKRHKEKSDEKESVEGSADSLQLIKRMVELLETKSKQANLISKKETVEGIDEPPNFVEEVAARQKRLFVAHLSRETKISDIINFFDSVGEVVHVQLFVDRKTGVHSGYGFVDFASANEAKKALEKKNGEYLHDRRIILAMAKIAPYPPRPKYCFDHKVVWYEDYLRREGLLIEENETVEGHDDEDPNSAEVVIRKKTLFVANLSPQTEILDVCEFFHNVGQVVSVRLIVNHEGRHVGYGFVEFFSANEAKKALKKKNGQYLHDHKIYLDVAKIAPYPQRTSYENYLQRESLLIEEDETVEGLDEDPDLVEEVSVRKKTLFVANLSPQTEISDICKFFHNVGEVAHVRLIVDDKRGRAGYGFVEFASASEAKKVLEKKKGEYLHDHEIFLDVAKGAKYLPPKYCINHKVWYEDYLRRESLLIEENETVEGLVEEVVARKKTLFVANLPPQTEILDVCKFFHNTGKIVSQRLIVNHEGNHVGCGFLEFASAHEAKKALKKKQGDYLHDHKIFLDMAKIAPYPPRPKYKLAEKLWYEDYLRQESLLIEEDDWKTKPIPRFCGTKTTFADDEEAIEDFK